MKRREVLEKLRLSALGYTYRPRDEEHHSAYVGSVGPEGEPGKFRGYIVAWLDDGGNLVFVGARPFEEPPECMQFLRLLLHLLDRLADD